MTTTSSRFFDELAKLMTNAAGAAQGVRREIDTLVKAQVERVLNDVGRRAARGIRRGARDGAEGARGERAPSERIAELEARLGMRRRQRAADNRPRTPITRRQQFRIPCGGIIFW